ncbi:capsular biosynthesis protein [Burkholderia sp. 22PA0099]|uniref:capsular polysaccharide export protein, LipB/KpsS family n=1 Tax=Burkholderia sp. 22PA0099 TaxID=3237372 RepID=UPI0039C2B3DA
MVLIDERTASDQDAHATRRQRRTAFDAMLRTAFSLYANADFWLYPTADDGRGKWLSASAPLSTDVRRLQAEHSLHEILRTPNVIVFVVAASEGMGALLAGVPVHIFGSPYYSGWGLTQDHDSNLSTSRIQSLETLFEAVFLKTAIYRDPVTNTPGSLIAALDFVDIQHAVARRYADLQSVAGVAFQWWKRPFATPYLLSGGGRLRWVRGAPDVQTRECAAIWGGRSAAGLQPGVAHFRIEDGFLHSTGLGSDMIAPFSQVIDRLGIYFDSSRPNELTEILNNANFEAAELRRAAALRKMIVQYGLTKYNLGRRRPEWAPPSGKRVILVSGQVADDASIRLGTQGIATSEALIDTVRTQNPNAFIVYKPHPDVLSGNRLGHIGTASVADIVDRTSDLISLIEIADEVHTLSSLSGFEALLRGKTVHTYGLPFYAGWGLTHDALPQRWRKRELTIDMLVAGVLIRYPVYWDWSLRRYTSVEAIVHKLAAPAARPLRTIASRQLRFLIKAMRWARNALLHVVWRMRAA